MSTAALIWVIRFTVDGQPFALPMRMEPGIGLTPREHGAIRRATGLAGGEDILKNIQSEDVLAVLCQVAAQRAGQTIDLDALLDGKVAFTYVVEEEESGDPPTNAGAADAPQPATSTTRAAGGAPS